MFPRRKAVSELNHLVFVASALRLNAFILLVLVAVPCAIAQETVLIRIINNAVLVPVEINGRHFNFLLDTGSDGSAINTSTAADLKLIPHETKKIQKNFRDLVVDVTVVASLKIGNADFHHVELAEINLTPLSEALGAAVDGVLGNDILEQFAFKLSYSRRTLLVGPLARLGTLGKSIRLRRSRGQFLVSIALVSMPTELVLDTGTNSTNLSWKTWEDLTHVWTPKEIVEGIERAGNPTSQAILVCLPLVRLGSVTIKNQVVRAQQKSDAGSFSSEDFGGIVGSDVLQQFETTFDLQNNRMFLTPDTQYRSDPYRYVTIGIQIAKNATGAVQIMSVWKDSPAAHAGFKPGDLIKAVDGQPIDALSLEQVSGKLHAAEGTSIRITIERNAETSTIAVQTRSLLCVHDRPQPKKKPSIPVGHHAQAEVPSANGASSAN
jgi:predicted aspartyl protease